jgi:signal transduction histidine kinase/CheY-like chemotaxis protein
MRKLYIIIACLFFNFSLVFSQVHQTGKRLEYSHFGVPEGLSHTQVNHSFQDTRGLVWLVTQNGLNVFDGHRGYTVTSWPALISHRVFLFRMEDHKQVLWLRYFDGEHVSFRIFDIRTREELSLGQRLDTQQVGFPVDAACDKDGLVLIINSKSELWKEQKDGTWKCLSNELGNFRTFCVGKQLGERIWVSTENTYMEPDDVRITTYDYLGHKGIEMYLSRLIQMSGVNQDRIWVQCEGQAGFLYADGSSRWLTVLDLRSLVSTSERILSEYDPLTNRLWVWKNDRLSTLSCKVGASDVRIQQLAEVNLKLVPFALYIGANDQVFLSAADGMYVSKLAETSFKRILWKDESKLSRLSLRESRGMLETKGGDIYLLVGNFLYRYDQKSGSTRLAYKKEVGISPIIEDPVDGSLWFGMINHYWPSIQRCDRLQFPLQGEWGVTWSSTFLDSNTILLGTSNGLVTYDKRNHVAKEFSVLNGFEELRKGSVYYINQERPGEWWLLSDKGLYVLTNGKGITSRYCSSEERLSWLPGDNFRHYYRDSQGTYWIASSRGLIKWMKESGQSEIITREHGLPNDNLYAVYGDGHGFLWLSSDYGLIKFHPKTGSIRYFFQEDGVANNEFNRISHLQLRDGTLFFGGINGVTTFHPDSFFSETEVKNKAEVIVMSIKSLNRESNKYNELLTDYYNNQQIILAPGNNLLSIEFTLPSYLKGKETSYSYQVDGLSKDWVYTKSPTIQLLGLAPGEYTLLIRGSSGSGDFSSATCTVKIKVTPYYYQKGWFWLICAMLLIGFVWLLLRYRERILVRQQKNLELKIAQSTQQIRSDKELIERQAIQLKNQNEAQRRFFANITHEFRTPLSLVMGPVDVVRRQSSLSRRFKSLLDISHQNSRRLLDLVDSVLVMSTLEVQQWRRREDLVSVEALISSVLEEYTLLAEHRQISLEVKGATDGDQMILADAKAIRIILNNLLSNALKYTSSGGAVRVSIVVQRNELILTVVDTGRGIPPEDLSRVFERYFQTSRNDTPLEGGTGIGLAIVKELAEVLGGHINVESNIGVGSTFSVRLPVKSTTNLPEVSQKASEQKGKKSRVFTGFKKSNSTIMIVEDNPDFQQYLEYLLNEHYSIIVSNNGKEALIVLGNGLLPDILITDWMMPEMDGLQLATVLKSHPDFSSIPVIFLTARSMESDIQKVLRLGIDDYLIKPFEEEELLTVVEQLLKRTKSRQENKSESKDSIAMSDRIAEELAWLEKLQRETLHRISNELFSVDQLASVMLMGRTKFYKEVNRLTGMTPNEYILEARLVRARMLMETQSDLTLKKVVQMVGLKDEGNFSRAFKKRFGNPPSWYL